MTHKFKRALPYILLTLVILVGQMFFSFGLVTGAMPALPEITLTGERTDEALARRPAIVYFWAEWCGICASMRESVSALLEETGGVTVALQSGDDRQVLRYLSDYKLAWSTLNDQDGVLAALYQVKGVPAVFIIDTNGQIRFAGSGYHSELGLRLRLALAGLGF
ncbi:MAG: redoxin domain-containing protein [Methylococcales bacterium]|nr:redoxin domain-containing protein [Methylococcales bacterium]